MTAVAVLSTVAPLRVGAAKVLTGKERLSDKGSDEQRINNCKVPPARRGTASRPGCPPQHTGA